MKYGYGCLGFLSLLGILGIVTEERTFLAFLDLRWIFSTFSERQMR